MQKDNILLEDNETLQTSTDTGLRDMCLELLYRIDTFRWDVKRKHWSAPDWGTHLDFDKIQADLGDTLDTFAEVYFMSRNIDVDVPKSEYHSTDLSKSIARMLELCNSIINDSDSTEGIKNFAGDFSQDLEQYSGWNRIASTDETKQNTISKESVFESEELNIETFSKSEDKDKIDKITDYLRDMARSKKDEDGNFGDPYSLMDDGGLTRALDIYNIIKHDANPKTDVDYKNELEDKKESITESVEQKKPLGEFDSYDIEQILYQFIPENDESESILNDKISELVDPIDAIQVDRLLDKLQSSFNWQPTLMDVIEDKIIESKDLRQERIKEFEESKNYDVRKFEDLISEDNNDIELLASRKLIGNIIERINSLEYNGDYNTVYSVDSLRSFKRKYPNETNIKYVI